MAARCSRAARGCAAAGTCAFASDAFGAPCPSDDYTHHNASSARARRCGKAAFPLAQPSYSRATPVAPRFLQASRKQDMSRQTEGAEGRDTGWRRVTGPIRRHPWRTVLAIPLAVVVYTVALIPFTPSIGNIKKAKQEQPSVVLSADGKELAVFRRANRDWVKLSDISPNVKNALLATEDKRFYDHPGIDVVRTMKALVNTARGDREGGSTITQQLARNLYPEQIGRDPTITRKIKEAITALKIESVYSKDEILETYLNSVSFLYNAWGIEMAARTYFDKPAKDLNEVEAATLVGMLKGTAYYNPVMNPERALQRRNTVLAMMVKDGKLPEDRYERLKDQPLKLDFSRLPEFNGKAPYLAEALRRWLIDWADRHDYNIYADGLVVKTTIDSRLQDMATQAVERQTRGLQAVADVEWSRSGLVSLGSDTASYVAQHGHYAPFEYFWDSHPDVVRGWMRDSDEYHALRAQGHDDEAALKDLRGNAQFMAQLRKNKTMLEAGFLALEPQTGAIRAWVGGRDYEADKFDHVQQARRQPGSTFKPFVYGAAFEMGHSPDETLIDQPVNIQIDKNKYWRPGNFEGTPTGQPTTLRDALAKSMNTVTAQLMMEVGPSRVASLARAMGVRQSKLDEVPSLALGTSPVTLKEMVTSFGTIANGGNYIEPQLVTAVEDRQHNVLESFGSNPPQQALQSGADATLVDVMRGVIDYGTAAGLKQRFGLNGDLAGKTGTTQGYTDGWFILMHPNLVAGAWVGFNDNRVAMRSSYWGQGAHNALLLVGDFMQQSTKAGLVDPRATFAAPHTRGQDKPMLDRMGDWWATMFNSNPAGTPTETETAALPPVNLQPPQLEAPPSSVTATAPAPLPYPAPAVSPDAPVIADQQPQRVPTFPRPLDSGRPIDTIPGTQVYRAPDMAARDGGTDTAPPVNVVRTPPAASARAGGGSITAGSSSITAGGGSITAGSVPPTSAMGAPATTRTGDGTSSRIDGGTSRRDTGAPVVREDDGSGGGASAARAPRNVDSGGGGSAAGGGASSNATSSGSGNGSGSGTSDAGVGTATGSTGDSGQ
jgi:penicillin-binding protein 1A